MKKGQSVIILTMKDSGVSYVFGSLSAIYSMFNSKELEITYSALRNAVGAHIKKFAVDESGDTLQVIYDNKQSRFTLRRAPLLLAEK